ncbi:MAG: TetR/AcrR family transcriptional regulator [Candidatus Marinimicrobia bacterium]|nr:TetR/AcrR family transcriptional regulator [Candidatus Neomarinimicrobiota bacterium]
MTKKDLIIHAAIKVFARTGLERGKIADIAKEAGIGKGTVYEYFRSKDELFEAIEEYFISQMIEPLRELTKAPISPSVKISGLMDESIGMIVHMGDALLIVSEIMAQAARGLWHKSGSSALADMYDEYREIIIAILQEGVAKGEFRSMNYVGIATLLMGFIDGLVWQYLMIKDRMDFEKIKDEAIRSFMKGIEK